MKIGVLFDFYLRFLKYKQTMKIEGEYLLITYGNHHATLKLRKNTVYMYELSKYVVNKENDNE